jgi:hypothetical protein
VGEEITNQAVAMALIHGEAALGTGPEDTGRQRLGQSSDVWLLGRSQVNQAGEMGHDSVKRSNVDETELSESALQDLDPSLFRGLVSGGRVDRLDDFVDLRRNKGV